MRCGCAAGNRLQARRRKGTQSQAACCQTKARCAQGGAKGVLLGPLKGRAVPSDLPVRREPELSGLGSRTNLINSALRPSRVSLAPRAGPGGQALAYRDRQLPGAPQRRPTRSTQPQASTAPSRPKPLTAPHLAVVARPGTGPGRLGWWHVHIYQYPLRPPAGGPPPADFRPGPGRAYPAGPR